MAGKINLNTSKQDMTSNQCKQEGYYGSETDCSSFYRCVEDTSQVSMNGQKMFKRVDFECPPGTIFDDEIKACNFPDRMNPKPGCMQLAQDEDEMGWPGMPGIKCEHRFSKGACSGESRCNFTDPNNVFYIPCDTDCRNSHNAESGECTKQDFCTCGPLSKKPKPHSVHCRNITHAELFDKVCYEDCQCNHNTVGGGCNFYTNACECGERYPKGVKNECPYKTANEFFLHVIGKYKSIGIDILKIIHGPRPVE